MALFSKLALQTRLFLIGLTLLLILLSIVGVGISRAFNDSVLANAQASLRNQVLLMLASIDVRDGAIEIPRVMPDPRLAQANSELFAQIRNTDGSVYWKSRSLLDDQIQESLPISSEIEFFTTAHLTNGLPVYSTALSVEWETELGVVPFLLQIAESKRAYSERIAEYNSRVLVMMALLGAVMLATLLLLFSWFLKPLKRITQEVSEVETGQRQSFNEDYPVELNQLTHNLNQLLDHEERRIQRQKEVLGNLAHSLKTPIAILNGLPFDQSSASEAQEQLAHMQTIIDYQLQSASTIGRRRFAKPIDVSEISLRVVASMKKLHAAKSTRIDLEIAQNVLFYGDEGDWHELFGNLLDNAFKWATSVVTVSLKQTQPLKSYRTGIELVIADDGPGMSLDNAKRITKRGVRLDSQTPGHGLGLNIVQNIVGAYDANLSVDTSEGSGTRWVITFS